jgi:hypothetical protein
MTTQQLNTLVSQATNNPQGFVSWIGANGLKLIQQQIIATLRERGVVTVPNTTVLQTQTFNNTPVCYVIGGGFYRWYAQGTPNGTTIFPAADGGVWALESQSNVGSLQQVTNVGNQTTNDIIAKNFIANDSMMSQLFTVENSGSLVFDTGTYNTTITAETATHNRSIIVPNENGTLATREWVQSHPVNNPTFIWTQNTASSTWVITHNLNSYPSVTSVDDLNVQIVGDLSYTNLNQVILNFSSPVTGKAYLN